MKMIAHFLAMLACLAVAVPAASAQKTGDREEVCTFEIPEATRSLTAQELTEKVPRSYYFDYRGQPQPGPRWWLRLNDSTWIERYPDGLESRFNVVGHATVNGIEGTIVVKVSGKTQKTGTDNAGGLQAFIPDKGSKVMHHLYRNTARGDAEWFDLGEMKSVE